MPTNQNRLLAARRPLSFATAISALFLSMAPFAKANPHILVDVNTGRVLDHEEAFRKWYPASLTKLMTVYTVFKAIKAGQISLDTPIAMSKRAAAQPPAKMYFKPGQKLTLDSALKIMLVKSANDIAMAVGEAVGGTQEAFVTRMNAEALQLGMTDSHFINPNGLPGKGQYTTARDLAILTVALRREFPQYAGYFSLEGFTTGTKQVPNINMLIGRFDGADGMKTGFICAAGFNQIASATRNGRTLVSIVLGTDSLAARADASANYLEYGFAGKYLGTNTLGSLRPYGPGQDQVSDISAEICNPKAAQVRSETRDEAGRTKIQSPYIHEMDHPPQFVFAGLLPPTQAAPPKTDKVATAEASTIANVPIPMPRPTSF